MKRVWTINKIIEYIEENGYHFIEMIEYKSLNSKIKIKCSEGHEYEVNFKNFKGNACNKGQRCPRCRGRNWTYEEVKDYIESKGLILISDVYINATTKLKISCKYGHIFERNFHTFHKENRISCPCCKGGKLSINIDTIRHFLNKIDYELMSDEYTNAITKLKIKCNNGHVFHKSWNKLSQGQRCPFCNMSKGEIVIYDFLKNNGIDFVFNKDYFKDLKSELGFYLRPDFILPSYKIWIEYDGEFHYKNMVGEDSYKKLIKHDDMKDKYAKEHGWKLIRIPYWEFDNIENILIKNL